MPQAATAVDTSADGGVDSCDTNGDGRLDAFGTNGDERIDGHDTTGDGIVDAYDTNGGGRSDLVTALVKPQSGKHMAPVEAAGLRQLRLSQQNSTAAAAATTATAATATTAAAAAAADDDDEHGDDGDDLARFHSCQSEPLPGSAVPSSTAEGGASAKATPPGQQQQLDSLFARAIARGLTDEDCVRTMRRKIETGSFTAQHYITMWSLRLDGTPTPHVSVALYAFGCVSVLVGTILLIVDGPAPMRAPEPGEREEWERETIETQAFDVPDQYSQDLKYREGTIFGAWWEHLVLVGWICFLISAIIQRCKAKQKAGHFDGATTMRRRHASCATILVQFASCSAPCSRSKSCRPNVRCAIIRQRLLKDWSSVAASVAVLSFVVSTCAVLAFTIEDSEDLLLFWEVKCDRVVCWVHEFVGRILVAAMVFVALLLLCATTLFAEAEQHRRNADVAAALQRAM